MSVNDQPVKEKNIGQVVSYLTNTFGRATQHLDRPFRHPKDGANKAYQLQTEFAYLINEIMQSPTCVQQKYITACNELIETVLLEKRAASKAKESSK